MSNHHNNHYNAIFSAILTMSNNTGLTLLGILSLSVTIGTGVYFSPMIDSLKPAYIAELKRSITNHTQTANIPISSTQTPNKNTEQTTKQPNSSQKTQRKTPTPAMICLSLAHQKPPYEFWLHDKFAKVATDANGITKTSFNTLAQSQLIVFDDNGVEINEQFFIRLLELHEQYESLMLDGDIFEYRKKACIEINYLKFDDDYYVYPIN